MADSNKIHIFRRYAKTIKRPFELRYDPYTGNVEVLDTPHKVAGAVSGIIEELCVINSAMQKLQTQA